MCVCVCVCVCVSREGVLVLISMYSAESLTLVRAQRCIKMIYYCYEETDPQDYGPRGDGPVLRGQGGVTKPHGME